MKYDIIVIGAGPAGLLVAAALGHQNKRVLLLEKNSQVGKKLLISGAGQCNITHAGNILEFDQYYGDGYKYIKKALTHFTNRDTIDFFEKRDLPMISMENGKIFPKTLKASDVIGVLLRECVKYNVDIHYNEKVNKIENLNDEYSVCTDDKEYHSRFIVIATGGMSYPKTGSTGDGYQLGQQVGHTIITPRPALTPVQIEKFPFGHLAGISFEQLPFSIWREGKKLKECIGDILFTHKGLSGPGILNNSRWMKDKDVLCCNFIKEKDIRNFQKQITLDLNASGKDMIKTFLKRYDLPKRMNDALLNYLNIGEEVKCAQISKETRMQLAKALVEFPLTIEKLGGYHIAMVTAGGIHMKEINPTTMESRIARNIYFIGEVVDIDGDTGGYNIQAAFSMAMLCANSIQRKEKR